MRFILGVDGGGTKTQAAIVDEQGHVLGLGVGGPANFDSVGVETAQRSIAQAVAGAKAMAGLSDVSFSAAFLGMAGVVSAEDRAGVLGLARALDLSPPDSVGVDHDCRVALAGALSGRPGIVLIVGTGSSCYGENRHGRGWRAGGWGHLIADEGSSYWLGVQAMRAATASYDGRIGPTALVEVVMRQLDIDDMQDLMRRLYSPPGLSKSEIASLAPAIIDAVRQGDAVALELLRQGARVLANCVAAVARHLDMTGVIEVAPVGGLTRAGDIFINLLREAICAQVPSCRMIAPEMPPVLGASLLGLRQLAIPVNAALTHALRDGASMIQSLP